eukprot:2502342-Pyramimonas_sp.AAC.1
MIETQKLGGPRGLLGSALWPPGGAPGAALAALRAPSVSCLRVCLLLFPDPPGRAPACAPPGS